MMSTLHLCGALAALALPAIAAAQAGTRAAAAQGDGTGAAGPATLPSVVVSARKRDETIIEVPLAVSSFSAQTLDDYGIHTFTDYASKVPNLSFAYGNGTSAGETGTGIANARTIAIRGVSGARTTGYYVDDTPLPGAIDVRVLDLRGIEILKGPQGTLFGESSMGGNVRLLTNAPSLSAGAWRYQLDTGYSDHAGGLNAGVSTVGNIVLSPGVAALRIVAFGERLGGYLSRIYRSDPNDPASALVRDGNQAAQRSFGASVTALLRPLPQLDVTLRLMHQYRHDQGIPASYAPLPAFRPVDDVPRAANAQPEAADNWTLLSLALDYAGAGWTLHSATSHFKRLARDVEDSTEGTAQYLASKGAPVPPQAFIWRAQRRNRQLSHETRIAFHPAGKFSGIVGIHYASLHSVRDTPPVLGSGVLGRPGETLLWEYNDRNRQQDLSLFGELYYRFLPQLTLTVGERRYWLKQDDRTAIDGAIYGVAIRSATAGRAAGNSPKVALAYQPQPDAMLYASSSKGFRAGGAQADLSPLLGGCITADDARRLTRVDADTLWSHEVGGKLALPAPGLLLTGALYQIDWDRIQQPAFVPSCAFYLLGNAGAARIRGAELEASGRVNSAFSLRFGLGYEDARITAQGSSRQLAGERIKQVPAWTATLGGVYSAALAPGWNGFVGADVSYTGNSVSSNATRLALLRPAYSLLNARLGVRRGQSEWIVEVKNLGNARVNLGDLGYLGYQRFEADGKTPLPQVATLPPRTITVQYRQRY
ncbi:MAG: TonB-dependent receptor [Pseudomonadota bacterium]